MKAYLYETVIGNHTKEKILKGYLNAKYAKLDNQEYYNQDFLKNIIKARNLVRQELKTK